MAIILLSLEAGLFLFLIFCLKNSVDFEITNSSNDRNDKPHFEKKLLFYEYETVIEYDYGTQITQETLPINVFDNSYGYIVNGRDLRLLSLNKRFANSRSNFRDGQIILSNKKPPMFLENTDGQLNL